MRGPIVLGYHAVSSDWDVPMAVSPARLERQVRRLMHLGFRPALFANTVQAPRRERTFVVTFDDGYRSVLERAVPVLDRLGVPATLFVPTGWVGDGHPKALWEDMEQWRRPGKDHELELMSWDEIRMLVDRGWEIGSHTHSHPMLTRLDDAALVDELVRSRRVVEAEIAGRCRSIAYPFGEVDDRVEAAALEAGYAAGAALEGMRELTRRRRSTPLRWRRVGVYLVDRELRFDVKLALASVGSRGGTMSRSRAAPPSPVLAPVPPGSEDARVAVVVPCFNDGMLALEAVRSIVEAEPVELVVVDDASTDPETWAALELMRTQGVTVVRHEVNRGLSAARRTGLAATTAPYVFPLDADDLMVPGALVALADRLDADPGAAASFGDVEEFGTSSRHVTVPVALDAYRVAYRNDYPVSSLFRRSVLEQVGAWQDVGGMVGYEDWNLWMTLAERGDTAFHAHPGFAAIRRRLHGPRMLGDSARSHGRLYAELRRTHPRLFADIRAHRRRSTLSRPRRLAYPLLFGRRPPFGLRQRYWALGARVRRALSNAER